MFGLLTLNTSLACSMPKLVCKQAVCQLPCLKSARVQSPPCVPEAWRGVARPQQREAALNELRYSWVARRGRACVQSLLQVSHSGLERRLLGKASPHALPPGCAPVILHLVWRADRSHNCGWPSSRVW